MALEKLRFNFAPREKLKLYFYVQCTECLPLPLPCLSSMNKQNTFLVLEPEAASVLEWGM